MQIPLDSFEQFIDETILQRGLKYFKKGYVNEPELIDHNVYEFEVEGTDTYTLQLTIEDGVVVEHVCSCPYDWGSICKHVVAALFHLQQDELNIKSIPKPKSKPLKLTGNPKRKSIADQIDGILEKLSHDDLKSYLKELLGKDKNLRNRFIAKHEVQAAPLSRGTYLKQIKAIVNGAMGRKGYVDYYDARGVGDEVYDLVKLAEGALISKQFQQAFCMASAIVEGMTDALQMVDDSNGDIGGNIDPALNILYNLSSEPISEALRVEMFQYCTKAFAKKIFDGWDWHIGMLSLATRLAITNEEYQELHTLLDGVKTKADGWDWDYRKAQGVREELVRKEKGQSAAEEYMKSNIDNPDFRKKTIELAVERKDYSTAVELCKDGVERDKVKYPGLANDWQRYLLRVYTLLNDTPNVIKYARELFLYSIHHNAEYFKVLKSSVSKHDWDSFVEGMINELQSSRRWVGINLIANIYIWEKRWLDLLKLVEHDPSLNNIDCYQEYLAKEFPDKVAALYQQAILKYMQGNVSRKDYQIVCRYLRRMIKMGQRQRADATITNLRELYSNRPALMDELQRV